MSFKRLECEELKVSDKPCHGWSSRGWGNGVGGLGGRARRGWKTTCESFSNHKRERKGKSQARKQRLSQEKLPLEGSCRSLRWASLERSEMGPLVHYGPLQFQEPPTVLAIVEYLCQHKVIFSISSPSCRIQLALRNPQADISNSNAQQALGQRTSLHGIRRLLVTLRCWLLLSSSSSINKFLRFLFK